MAFESINDTELLSLLIYGEARGESTVGKLAVAKVAINRSKHPSWWGKTLRECILKPHQFSCFNDSDPNSMHLANMARLKHYDPICLTVAELAMSGYTIDPTDCATHYHADYVAPSWSKTMVLSGQIGHHLFYKERT